MKNFDIRHNTTINSKKMNAKDAQGDVNIDIKQLEEDIEKQLARCATADETTFPVASDHRNSNSSVRLITNSTVKYRSNTAPSELDGSKKESDEEFIS